MKVIALGSFFVLFAIIGGITIPTVFADHMTASVSIPSGTNVPGCEDTNECFIPATVTIDVGGEVTWTNDDASPHTVTAGDLNVDANTVGLNLPNGFDSGMLMKGQTFTHKFEVDGEFPYFCMVHPWMTGMVVVEGEAMDDHDGDMMEEASASGMLSDGVEVEVWTTAATAGERMTITVVFDDSEHVNYDIMVTQKGNTVLDDKAAHEHEGMGEHMTAPLSSVDPVDITITFQGYGISDPKTGPIGEKVVFTNVVPEFGTIAALILVVAIVSIIAVTARTKLSLTPRI